jgi:hypothetical protein
MTIRWPKGMRPTVTKFAPQIEKLARKTVAEVTGKDEPQWSIDTEPLGNGSWGVVWPLADERFILKVTADPTEGPIIATIMEESSLHNHMAIIHYFALRKLPEAVTFRNKTFPLFVIIAERLQHSSDVKRPNYGTPELRAFDRFAHALYLLKESAGRLVREQNKKRPNLAVVDRLYGAWMDDLNKLNDGPMEDFIIQFYDYTRDPNEGANDAPSGGVLADIHFNNVGKRVVDWTDLGIELSPDRNDMYWVISDPGHSSLNEKPAIADIENPRRNPATRNKDLEAAVKAAQLYHGSTACNVRDAQKLYTRMQKACDRVAKACGNTFENVMQQVGAEASRRGPITPTPGKDI